MKQLGPSATIETATDHLLRQVLIHQFAIALITLYDRSGAAGTISFSWCGYYLRVVSIREWRLFHSALAGVLLQNFVDYHAGKMIVIIKQKGVDSSAPSCFRM